ncbi:MAG: amidohydrolase family protein [Deltaproteobacteria bacterium]|nr:amidohydrolase family protein [Deltaproteobacteria bacterium]
MARAENGRLAVLAASILAVAHPVGCRGSCPGPTAPVPEAEGPACGRAQEIYKIDAHAHIRQDATARALSLMDAWGIRTAINVSGGSNENVELSTEVEGETGGRIRFFCNIDFDDWDTDVFAETAVASLERCARMGGLGLKIFKGLGLGLAYKDGTLAPVDDPVFDPIFEKAGELGMPVLIHSGDPKAFFEPPDRDNERYDELSEHPSWSFHGDDYPSWEQVYKQFENRVGHHPKTTFIGAHFGNNPEDPERVFKMIEDYPNFYADTAARVPEIGRFDPVRMKELMTVHQDRILFGTDLGISVKYLALGSGPPYKPTKKQIQRFFTATYRYFETDDRQFDHPTPIQGRWKIDGIDLDCDVLEKIYHANVERLLRLEGP